MQWIEPLINFATVDGPYAPAKIYEVGDHLAAEWIGKGMARASDKPPLHIASLLARLEDGAGKRCLFLPHLGEFGHTIMSHIRIVHWHKAARKIVCCRPGEEVLYPSADRFVTEWEDPIPDGMRVGSWRETALEWSELRQLYAGCHCVPGGGLSPEQEIYPLHHDQRIPFRPRRRGLRADVLLAVRNRRYCRSRNWQHWQTVADALTAAGYTFAVIGHRETSLPLIGQSCHSGDFDTDAAIELMENCRLFIGTDSGGSHLASTVGCPMLLFRETAGGSRDLTPRMEAVNPGRIGIVSGGWDNPRAVIDRAMSILQNDTWLRRLGRSGRAAA